MQQVKIFKNLESDIPAIEREINRFLESGVKVLNIFGNISPQSQASSSAPDGYLSKTPTSPSDVFLVVVYEKAE
jgi:hypothetical protein